MKGYTDRRFGTNFKGEGSDPRIADLVLILKEGLRDPWTADLVGIFEREMKGPTDGQIGPIFKGHAGIHEPSIWCGRILVTDFQFNDIMTYSARLTSYFGLEYDVQLNMSHILWCAKNLRVKRK